MIFLPIDSGYHLQVTSIHDFVNFDILDGVKQL